MSRGISDVRWSTGASPEGTARALAEAALAISVLAALLEDSALRKKAAALRSPLSSVAEIP